MPAPGRRGVEDGTGVPARAGEGPLHVKVAQTLRQEISEHLLAPGTPLPSEAALQERFSVSRSVVRQALGALSAEGLVARGRGRGSVVAPAAEHHRLVTRSSGLVEQLAAEGHAVTTQVLERVEEVASAQCRWLGSDRVLRLERRRSVGGRPLARIRTYLPLPAAGVLTAAELTDASLHRVLRERLDLVATSGPRQVRAVSAGPALADDLQVPTGSPLLLLEGQTVDQHGHPLEVFATWHRGSDVAFDLQADGRPGPDASERAGLAGAAARARALAEHLERLAGG